MTLWDGKIVAKGTESRIKVKLAQYQAQLMTTSNPVLQTTFTEDIDVARTNIISSSSDDEENVNLSGSRKRQRTQDTQVS